jgi:hypothetical protein
MVYACSVFFSNSDISVKMAFILGYELFRIFICHMSRDADGDRSRNETGLYLDLDVVYTWGRARSARSRLLTITR